jgi:integrase
MARVHESDSGRWQVRWSEGGRGGRSRSLTVDTEREAERLRLDVEEALDRCGRYEPRRVGEASDLGLILADYVADCTRRLRPGTVKNYAQHLELFRRWAGPVNASALSYTLLSDYHVHLSSPVSGRHVHRRGHNTVVKHFQALEGLWAWAWQRQARGTYHGIPQPDTLGLKHNVAPHKLAPTWAEMDAMIAASSGWHRQLYTVLRCTGLRVGQALGLRWSDIRQHGDLHVLHVRPELGKTRQERRGRLVPLAPVLVREIAGWGARDGWLIPCPRKARIGRARDAQRAWARAGVDPEVWSGCAHHVLRAGFITGLKGLGADLEAVEFLVGHSRGIREHYSSPDALELVEAVGLVPDLASVGTASVRPARRLAVFGGGGRSAEVGRQIMGLVPRTDDAAE